MAFVVKNFLLIGMRGAILEILSVWAFMVKNFLLIGMRSVVWGFFSFVVFVLKFFCFSFLAALGCLSKVPAKEKGDLGSLIFFP